jgi:outer membrane protein TolC
MYKINKHSKFHSVCDVGVILFIFFTGNVTASVKMTVSTPLSFEQTIRIAQNNDPWLTGSSHKQNALESMSIAVNTLPDPKMSISIANLPVNGFDFSQEGMTQAKVGISQMFPRGDTLEIKSQQLKTQSEAYPYQRKDRESKVAVIVGTLWLDAYRVEQSIALIERSRALFEQLVGVAEASYSSAVGKTRQQDIVRSQLELTRLEERLDILGQQKYRFKGMLSQWLTTFSDEQASHNDTFLESDFTLHNIDLSQTLPLIDLVNTDLVLDDKYLKPIELIKYFSNHPSVIAIEMKVSAFKTGIKLAKQKHKPEWGVNASYGYRADDPFSRSRADLFSVGVTFDLPLFTESRQDKEVQSAISETEAVKTEKLLLLRQLLGSYISAKGRLLRLIDRKIRYKTKLLPQIYDQAEASLTAYTNDVGDFFDVVRARISVLNAEIDELTLNVEEQKIRLELNYLFVGRFTASTSQMKSIKSNKSNEVNSNQSTAILGENNEY